LFLCKQHKNELDSDFKDKFLAEMSKVSEAVYKSFKTIKLNYELTIPTCTGTYSQGANKNQSNSPSMVWTPREQMYAENLKVNDEELSALKKIISK
jgi:hypothetical protein